MVEVGGMWTYLGVFSDRGQDGLVICVLKVHERRLESLIRLCDLGHIAERPAIHVVHADDMRIRSKRLQNGGCRR